MAATLSLAFACGLALSACIGESLIADCNDTEHVLNRTYKECESALSITFNCETLEGEVCELAPYFECMRSSTVCEDGALVVSEEPCEYPSGCEKFLTGGPPEDGSETDTDTN